MRLPFVTIIMPIRNEAAFIEKSLGAVLAQDYPADNIEIVIVDGMSVDGTIEIVHGFMERYTNLFMIDNPAKIVSAGLNKAIANAKGEIIVRVDGHCIIAPDYIRHCVEHLKRNDIDSVGGPLTTVGDNRISQVISLAMSSRFGVGGSAFRTMSGKTMFADTVPFPAYKRSTIERAGPFDEELVRNQDEEYNYRLRKIGAKILLAADVNSQYYCRSSLKGVWQQYFQYGYWKVRVLQKHFWQMSLRQFVPPAFVLAILGSFVLTLLRPNNWTVLFLVVGFYGLANLIASLWTASQNGWRYFPILPLVYCNLHLSYGAGFLLGLVRFVNRWGDR